MCRALHHASTETTFGVRKGYLKIWSLFLVCRWFFVQTFYFGIGSVGCFRTEEDFYFELDELLCTILYSSQKRFLWRLTISLDWLKNPKNYLVQTKVLPLNKFKINKNYVIPTSLILKRNTKKVNRFSSSWRKKGTKKFKYNFKYD